MLLQFGKTGEDEFTMDYTYPFNAIQVPVLVCVCVCVYTCARARVVSRDCSMLACARAPTQKEIVYNDTKTFGPSPPPHASHPTQAFGVVLSSFDSKLACE